MLYFVTQSPKGKHRDIFCSFGVIVEADSTAAAVRQAVENNPEEFGDHVDYSKPKAELLTIGVAFRF